MELADMLVLETRALKSVGVQVPPSASGNGGIGRRTAYIDIGVCHAN